MQIPTYVLSFKNFHYDTFRLKQNVCRLVYVWYGTYVLFIFKLDC